MWLENAIVRILLRDCRPKYFSFLGVCEPVLGHDRKVGDIFTALPLKLVAAAAMTFLM